VVCHEASPWKKQIDQEIKKFRLTGTENQIIEGPGVCRVFLCFTGKAGMSASMGTGFICGYFIVMNVIGLFVMGIDKEKAKRHAWRIPEKTLFLVSLLGGSAGTWLGMYLFRHKTKHWYFVIGMPAILIVQVVIAVLFWRMQ
jgi:uncharacterized membrane protein YsdA (DUF1294 family)